MKLEDVKKRMIRVEGVPLKPYIEPRAEIRRENPKVSNTSELDTMVEDFFEFEEDLSEMESARKQFERIEEEKILTENRIKTAQIEKPEDGFFTLETETEKQIPDPTKIKSFSTEPKPFKIPVEKKEQNVKFCSYIKANGDRCKRAAINNANYCNSHRNIVSNYETTD